MLQALQGISDRLEANRVAAKDFPRAWEGTWLDYKPEAQAPCIRKLKGISEAEKAALQWAKATYGRQWKDRLRWSKNEHSPSAARYYERPFGYDYLNDNLNVARMALDKIEGRTVRDLPVLKPPKEA